MNIDYKYSFEIIEEKLNNKYICPEVKRAFETSIEALGKQISKSVNIGKYDVENDNYSLHCPMCNSFVGSLENEDNEDIYKYNIVFNWCPECGQKLGQPFK